MYNVYFLSLHFVLLAVVCEHDLRCFVIIFNQPRLIEGLLEVVQILLCSYCAMPVTIFMLLNFILILIFVVISQCGGTDHATPLYPQKLALTSPTSGGRSVGIVRSRTKATELVISVWGYMVF
jgi:hypothetical protein